MQNRARIVKTASTSDSASAAGHNPFSASRVRPGAVDYLFPAGASADLLIAKLQANRWRGAVVGPHGSGKSTLLKALLPALAAAGKRVVEIDLRSRANPNHALAGFLRDEQAGRGDSALIVVDGYEQLTWPSRWRLRRFCRRNAAGLLVTAHQPTGLPTLLAASADLPTARQVVERLLPPGDTTVTHADIAACFHAHRGNMREILFALYDLYEQRRRSSSSAEHKSTSRTAGS